jgi:hypothetical protein
VVWSPSPMSSAKARSISFSSSWSILSIMFSVCRYGSVVIRLSCYSSLRP